VFKSVKQAKRGDGLTTRVADGAIVSTVIGSTPLKFNEENAKE
jgi:NAD kinase